jgi:hypothetical protein
MLIVTTAGLGDRHSFKHEFERVKFSLSHRQYQESMQRSGKQRCPRQTNGPRYRDGALRKGRSRSTQKYKSIQRHAGNLYKVIRRRWLCDCGAPHNANLRLDSRLLDHDTWTSSHDRGKATHDAIEFKVLFTVKTNNTSDSTSWSWQETEIRLLDQQYPQTGQSRCSSARTRLSQPRRRYCEEHCSF